MKNISLGTLCALGMTIPFIFSSMYSLVIYGNRTTELGMGGLEIVLFLYFIGAPIFIVSLLAFIYRISVIESTKKVQELKDFIIYLIVFAAIGYFLFEFSNYCSSGMQMCSFLPFT